ncbi:hypothetical protein [Zhaonella formicivorans]|uniref:hypothetical protein n=1 Tax=Zhaonella formicivorans TaxID=2528593 RepID=UPI0010DB04C6|nr:hypothetical protein [Zhaonella formicivorans]
MLQNLVSPAKDLWQFCTEANEMSYSLTLNSHQVFSITKCVPTIDYKNKLHLFVQCVDGKAYCASWDGSVWQKRELPFSQWEHLKTFVHSTNDLSVLAKTQAGFSFVTMTATRELPVTSLQAQDLGAVPIFFTCNNSSIYVHLKNNLNCSVSTSVFSAETGVIERNRLLWQDKNFAIIKQWVVEDSLLILVQEKAAHSPLLYCLKISLQTMEHCLRKIGPIAPAVKPNLCLAMETNNLLLIYNSLDCFYYSYSFDLGQNWTLPKQSSLFSPAFFNEVYTINDQPTSKICLSSIYGCSLQQPLFVSYSELSTLLSSKKSIKPKLRAFSAISM